MMHLSARKGDVLREEGDADLTPFRLRRDGRQIASPEWWQVRHLFVGLPMWIEEEDDDNRDDGEEVATPDMALLKLRRALPESGPGGNKDRCPSYIAVEALAPIADAGIAAGDVLIYTIRPIRKSDVVRARLDRVPRALFLTVLQSRLRFVESSYLPHVDAFKKLKSGMKHIAKNKRFLAAPDATSPLMVLRVPCEKVEPIHALSDDGAIFELLSQVGGRLPSESPVRAP